MIITNPNPVSPQPFGRMWITSLLVKLPTSATPGYLEASLHPYDGANLLMGGSQTFRHELPSADPQTATVMDALVGEVVRQRGGVDIPVSIVVLAKDPAQPVTTMIKFGSKQFYRIPDCFALAATDQTFAMVLITTMAEVARIAGLNFSMG